MKYRVIHNTNYKYKETVPLCYTNATIIPRNSRFQRLDSSNIEINPLPTYFHERKDFYGNNIFFFILEMNIDSLDINISSDIELDISALHKDDNLDIRWKDAVSTIKENMTQDTLDARQYIFESPLVSFDSDIYDFALESFPENAALLESILHLIKRIYVEFEYLPNTTNIYTPISHVLKSKKGVCQDFAQFAIGCLRSLGIPARYVSGYIENPKKEGQEIKGADASHGWISVYFPGIGWLDFDPTNNKFPCDQHVTIGWGRDYSDISPLKGIVYGASDHELSVSVEVIRL